MPRVDASEVELQLIEKAAVATKKELSTFLSEHPEADVNACDPRGDTPLIKAVVAKKQRNVECLIDKKADVNQPNEKNLFTPMMYCCMQPGLYEMALKLLEHNCNVNAEDISGNTALHYAVMKSFVEIVIMLLESDAKVNAANEERKTPLHAACAAGNLQIVEELLNFNANVNALCQNKRPVDFCRSDGFKGQVQRVLDEKKAREMESRRQQALQRQKDAELAQELYEQERREVVALNRQDRGREPLQPQKQQQQQGKPSKKKKDVPIRIGEVGDGEDSDDSWGNAEEEDFGDPWGEFEEGEVGESEPKASSSEIFPSADISPEEMYAAVQSLMAYGSIDLGNGMSISNGQLNGDLGKKLADSLRKHAPELFGEVEEESEEEKKKKRQRKAEQEKREREEEQQRQRKQKERDEAAERERLRKQKLEEEERMRRERDAAAQAKKDKKKEKEREAKRLKKQREAEKREEQRIKELTRKAEEERRKQLELKQQEEARRRDEEAKRLEAEENLKEERRLAREQMLEERRLKKEAAKQRKAEADAKKAEEKRRKKEEEERRQREEEERKKAEIEERRAAKKAKRAAERAAKQLAWQEEQERLRLAEQKLEEEQMPLPPVDVWASVHNSPDAQPPLVVPVLPIVQVMPVAAYPNPQLLSPEDKARRDRVRMWLPTEVRQWAMKERVHPTVTDMLMVNECSGEDLLEAFTSVTDVIDLLKEVGRVQLTHLASKCFLTKRDRLKQSFQNPSVLIQRLKEREVRQWPVKSVLKWCQKESVRKGIQKRLQQLEVTGDVLLDGFFDTDDVTVGLEMKHLNTLKAKTFLKKVERLRKECATQLERSSSPTPLPSSLEIKLKFQQQKARDMAAINSNSNKDAADVKRSSELPVEDEEGLCTVCLEQKANVIFYPCKHVAICSSCRKSFEPMHTNCTVCSVEIEKMDTIFVP